MQARLRRRRARLRLWTGKRDVSCCFYRCLLPSAWGPYLGLPGIMAAAVWPYVKGQVLSFRTADGRTVQREVRPGDRVNPLLGVVAMGLSHAVFLIQMFHEWLLRKVKRLVWAAGC